MSGGGAEAGNASIVEMMGAARCRYTRDKSGSCSSVDGLRDGEILIGGRDRIGYRRRE